MNITFWVLMILMLLLAIAILVFPVLRVRKAASLAYRDSNLKINDEKIKELDADLKEGRIDQHNYKIAREELDRELLIDVPQESRKTAAIHYGSSAKRQPALALMIAVFIPLVALLLYLDLGMHAASDESFVAKHNAAGAAGATIDQQPSVEEMVARLEAKIESEGGSLQEWIMLGRAYKYIGNNALAADAFAVALEQDSENAQLMLERAEVLALKNNRRFDETSRSLILKAYELDPDNANTLWFAGVAEFQEKNYRQAISHLKRLLPMARGEEDVVKSIISIVAKSREALIAAGEDVPELAQLLGVEAMMSAASQGKLEQQDKKAQKVSGPSGAAVSLQVTVDASDSVRQKFDENDVVFVYAKAKQGPRMPLAVQRLTLAALPTTVVLDDSMAMVEGMNISAFKELVVSARVTKTGSAIAQSGDSIGQIEVDGKKTETALNILIEKTVQ